MWACECVYTYSKWCKNQATSRSNRDDMAQRRVKRKRNEVMEDRKDEGWRKNGLNLRCCSVGWAECCLPSKMKKKRLQVPSQKHLETKNSQLKENEIRQFSIGFMCVGTLSKAHDCHVLALHSQWARARVRENKPIIFTSTINIIIFIHVYETLRIEQLVRLTNNHTSAQCTQRETFPVSTWPISLRIHFFLWQYSTTIICFKQTSHTLQTSVRSISTLQLNL